MATHKVGNITKPVNTGFNRALINRTLDKAINLLSFVYGPKTELSDAMFSHTNAVAHYKHLKEMGMNSNQYRKGAKWLSEQSIGGNIGGYVRKDGRQVRYNKETLEYVVFNGNNVISFFKIRKSQLERELASLKGE